MTAKEMFEKSGYKLTQDDLYWLIYKCNEGKWFEFAIEFDKKCRAINITGITPSQGKRIDLNELKAINKQIEELGWNNE